jgi:uncharacterized protein
MYTSLQKFGQGTVRLFLLLLVLSLWIPTTTVFSQGTPTDLIISEYIEGSSNNKALEIYNGTAAPINLNTGGYRIQMYFNGSTTAGLNIILNGIVAAGDVFVVAQSAASPTILAQADQTNGSGWFNGDDAVVLRKTSATGPIVDSIGQIGFDPGTEWSNCAAGTADNTILRKSGIVTGDTNPNDIFNPGLQWDGFASDTFAFLGSNNINAPIAAAIHDVQGSGTSIANPTTPVTVSAIVTADFSAANQLTGFFIQEEDNDADGNLLTSEGIFIYSCGIATPITVGDHVTVTGFPQESFGQSQINPLTGGITVHSSSHPLPTPATINLPVTLPPLDTTNGITFNTALANALQTVYEPYEGMRVNFTDTLTVSEYFELFRFGEVVLYEGGRPFQYTHVDDTPTQAEYEDHLVNLASRRLVIGDDNDVQNSSLPNGVMYYPQPDGFSPSNYFRGGDTVSNLTGILGFAFGEYQVRPVAEPLTVFTQVNQRPEAPTSDGRLTVASFNVLNYFLTIDTNASTTSGACGPNQNQDCRGADSVAELVQQTEKLVNALDGLNADIYGLIEMENTTGVEPLAYLVDELNISAGAGTYAYVDTGVIGTDAIRVGIIYDTTTVVPVGQMAVLDDPSFVNPFNAAIDRNRPALAQSFREIETGGVFTVVVNHLKSKGSDCGGAPDDSPFQGNCNGTRTAAAAALVDWLETDPTGVQDSDYLLIGDYNAYAHEDPISVLEDDMNISDLDFTDLNRSFHGLNAYSYVFDGQLGYLDYALSSAALTPQVVDITEWHINADEVPVLDYNDDVRDMDGEAAFEEEPDGNDLTEDRWFRTSDHDPVFVGLNLNPPTIVVTDAIDEGILSELSAVTTDLIGEVIFSWDLDNNGSFEATGNPVWITSDDGPAELPITIQACDELLFCVTVTTSITVNNVAPELAIYTVPAEPLFQGETVRVLFAITDPSEADTNAGFTISATCTAETALADELDCFVPTNTTNWSITGTATDKDGGEGNATLSDIEVLNTSAAINYIIDIVQTTSGLNAGQKNSLISKLLNIQQHLSNDNQALNQLNAFRNQVIDLQATGVLSVDDMNILLTLADRLAQSISNS